MMFQSIKDIRAYMLENADLPYKDFNKKLIPNIDESSMIGLRVPFLRVLAKQIMKQNPSLAKEYMLMLPHVYFEENILHALMLSSMKEYDIALDGVKAFLPYIDNWACCDVLSVKCFSKHRQDILQEAYDWMTSQHCYTIRFGIGVLLQFFLDEHFEEEQLYRVAEIKSEEYYVNMMIAWYMSTALAKQYTSAVKLLEKKILSPWVQNKSIQKAIESYRVTNKDYLRSLKIMLTK